MNYTRLLRYTLITAAAGLLSAAALAHPGQNIDLKIAINDAGATHELLLSADFLRTLLPREQLRYRRLKEQQRFDFASPEDEDQLRREFIELFADACPVMVDGMLAEPTLAKLEFIPAATIPGGPTDPLFLPPDLHVVVRHAVSAAPRRVSLVWGLYPRDPNRARYGLPEESEVVAQLDTYDENKIIVFTQEEPEVIWHAPLTPASNAVAPLVAPVEPPTIPLPVLSLTIVASAGLALLAAGRAGRAKRRAVIGLAAVTLLLAAGVSRVLVVRVAAPWQPRVELPSESAAVRIFAALHTNIYEAFNKKTESDIYDVLAQSVDGELLDQVYNEVYQSLIMREHGGAVARIKSVEVLEAHVESAGVLPGSSEPVFQVRNRWRVHGAVYHWGHVHWRTNEHAALYTIALRDGTWKIVGVEDMRQERILDSDSESPVGGAAQPAGAAS